MALDEETPREFELVAKFEKGIITKPELHELFKDLVKRNRLKVYAEKAPRYMHMAQYLSSKGVVVLPPTDEVYEAQRLPFPWKRMGITLMSSVLVIALIVTFLLVLQSRNGT